MSRLTPSPEQIAATDPERSSWVGANAGSGKTHVLTQRVARLLLAGAEPQKILCLTYTKAAASEMQTRLFRTLGRWAMAPAAELGRDLAALAGRDVPETDPATLARARQLFALALETPGGLKIQTIHAFCERLLRRFPLEAGVSPRFEVADERRSQVLLATVREAMAEAAAESFDCAAKLLNEGGLDVLAEAVLRRRGAFGGDAEARIAAHFGRDGTPAEVAAEALNELDRDRLASLTEALLAHGGMTERSLAAVFSEWLTSQCTNAGAAIRSLASGLLTKDGRPRRSGLATKNLMLGRPGADSEIAFLQDWAARARERVLVATVAERARDLHAFAEALLARHEATKLARALLDFDDLVDRGRALLTGAAQRAWVLYKLDQGIDHVLVDEAQDTAPLQWDVIDAIRQEFTAGSGARGTVRTIFAVGDEKQSIYSFQGAEPQAFGRMRDRVAADFAGLGTPLGRPALLTSYRSAPAILDFVDAVFAGEAAAGLTLAGGPVQHVAHRQGEHGRVDLWPLVMPEPADDQREWWRPVDAIPPSDTRERLAEAVAAEIGRMLREGRLGARGDRPARPIRPKDILVLVARRDRLAAGIIRRLKSLGVPVAGADRLRLTEELAVQDLLALAKVATMSSDELSLAALLRSPLCGLGEDELFRLAHGRETGLWQRLQVSGQHRQVADFLSDMAVTADFLRPYEFLERALVRHDGRRRLLARLGPEAEDAIDELLVQALAYEAAEAPSLAGFVAWIEAGEIEVRREMESGGDTVRVMTVHGAKGLEAPVVILPDTVSAGRAGGGAPLILPAVADGNLPELTIWAGSKDSDDAVAARARAAADAREKAERRRLLYVALTRAEDWLVLCGAAMKIEAKDCWYDMLAAGMQRCAPVTRHPSPTGAGEMLRYETGAAPAGLAAETPEETPAEPALPAWLGRAPREARPPRFSPSSLAPTEPHGGAGIGRETALRIGAAVHLLLERLPGHPAARRTELAGRLLASGFADLTEAQRDAAWAEAQRVIALPEAAPVFGPDSLAEVAAVMPGPAGTRMVGRIDRLVVAPDGILIVDIKTDRAPPADAATVPEGYLAQLGAYRAAVAAAFPDRPVATAILWTARPTVMQINPELTRIAFHASLAG